MRSFVRALIQCNWCPFKKKKSGTRQIQRENNVKKSGKRWSSLSLKQVFTFLSSKGANPTYHRLRFLASRIEEK